MWPELSECGWKGCRGPVVALVFAADVKQPQTGAVGKLRSQGKSGGGWQRSVSYQLREGRRSPENNGRELIAGLMACAARVFCRLIEKEGGTKEKSATWVLKFHDHFMSFKSLPFSPSSI